jgi:hypothetical protein
MMDVDQENFTKIDVKTEPALESESSSSSEELNLFITKEFGEVVSVPGEILESDSELEII